MAETNGDNLQYLLPLLLPIVMGMLIAFAHLQSDLAETQALHSAQILEIDSNIETVHSAGENKKRSQKPVH